MGIADRSVWIALTAPVTRTETNSIQVLQQLAAEINAQPYPEIKPHFGLRLPPEEDCLLVPNYQLDPATPALSSDQEARNVREEDLPHRETTPNGMTH